VTSLADQVAMEQIRFKFLTTIPPTLHADPPQSLMTEMDQSSQHDKKRPLSSVMASTSRVAVKKVHIYSAFSQTKKFSSTN